MSYNRDLNQDKDVDLAPGQQLYVKILSSQSWDGACRDCVRDTFYAWLIPPQVAPQSPAQAAASEGPSPHQRIRPDIPSRAARAEMVSGREVRLAKVGPAEVRHDEARLAEVWSDIGLPLPPSVPGIDTLLENFQVVWIGHLGGVFRLDSLTRKSLPARHAPI